MSDKEADLLAENVRLSLTVPYLRELLSRAESERDLARSDRDTFKELAALKDEGAKQLRLENTRLRDELEALKEDSRPKPKRTEEQISNEIVDSIHGWANGSMSFERAKEAMERLGAELNQARAKPDSRTAAEIRKDLIEHLDTYSARQSIGFNDAILRLFQELEAKLS